MLKLWKSLTEDYGHPNILGFNLTDLAVDEAFLKINSEHWDNLTLYQKSSLCYRCPYRKFLTVPEGGSTTLKYETNQYWSFIASPSDQEFIYSPERSDDKICAVQDVSMGQFGIYELNIGNTTCDVKILKDPVFIYGALIFAAIFYFLLAIVCKLTAYVYNSCKKEEKQENKTTMVMNHRRPHHLTYFGNPEHSLPQERPTPKKTRLQSLDTFRGITIALMILVNSGGGGYWFLEHAPWNGLRLADVVFPWFLWIMGVCIPMGIKSQLKKKTHKSKIFLRILKRSLKLFAIGIILNTVGGHNQVEFLRIPGVLQRFAVAYLFTASIYLLCGPSVGKDPLASIFRAIEDIIVLFPQWVIYILIMIGYTMVIFYVDIPGCPRGYLGPGGIVLLQEGEPSPNCIGGITRMVDIWLLGNEHIYQRPTARKIYDTASFDPEGILGSIPTLLQVFLGIQAGQILQTFECPKSRTKRWLSWGAATLFGSLALSSGIIIGGPIPVNKNLWSISYVLVTSALAFFLLTLCYVIVDWFKIWRGSPFYQAGMNSIFLYVGHFILYNVFPWHYKYGVMKTHLALLTEALVATTLWILVAVYLHKKKKFYTV